MATPGAGRRVHVECLLAPSSTALWVSPSCRTPPLLGARKRDWGILSFTAPPRSSHSASRPGGRLDSLLCCRIAVPALSARWCSRSLIERLLCSHRGSRNERCSRSRARPEAPCHRRRRCVLCHGPLVLHSACGHAERTLCGEWRSATRRQCLLMVSYSNRTNAVRCRAVQRSRSRRGSPGHQAASGCRVTTRRRHSAAAAPSSRRSRRRRRTRGGSRRTSRRKRSSTFSAARRSCG